MSEEFKHKIKFTREQIRRAEEECTELIKAQHKDTLILIIMNGAFIFASSILRAAKWAGRIEFMRLTTYKGAEKAGNANLTALFDFGDVKGKHVLLIEDIVDTGDTVRRVAELLKQYGAKSVEVITLLLREGTRRPPAVDVLNYGLMLDGESFVVGYGLDYNSCYRTLNYIAELISKNN